MRKLITLLGCYLFCVTLYAQETSIPDSTLFINKKPKNLAVENLSVNALNLKWDALNDAISYDVYKEGTLYKSEVKNNTVTIDGLKSFDIYYFTVKAKNAKGDYSQVSDSLYVATPETKEQKDARMAWWREARFGMFIHWGVYASYAGYYDGPSGLPKDKLPYYSAYAPYMVDSVGNTKIDPATGKPYKRGQYSEWIMFAAQIPRDVYLQEAYDRFKAEKYDAKEWVRMAKDAGMKYIVITSKHHDGFTLMRGVPGYGIERNSQIKQDLLKELVTEARAAGLKIGFYYSQALDWLNPGGMGWVPQNPGTNKKASNEERSKYVDNIVIPHLHKLVEDYGVDLVWWDMGGDSNAEFRYRMMKAIKNMPGNERLIFNARMADKLTADFKTPEQSIPDIPSTGDGTDWETCMTMNDNWGYCEFDHRWKSAEDLLTKLIDISSKGGNFLLNIGPKSDGTFPQESIDRLKTVGDWMKINGESVWNTTANPFENLPAGIKVTKRIENGTTTYYFHISEWPSNGQIKLDCLSKLPVSVSVLGSNNRIKATLENNVLVLKGLPKKAVHPVSSTIKLRTENI